MNYETFRRQIGDIKEVLVGSWKEFKRNTRTSQKKERKRN